MRKILIDNRIKGIADAYKKRIHLHGKYGDKKILINPEKRLKDLLEAFKNNEVSEYISSANKYKPLSKRDSIRYQNYISGIISEYNNGLLTATPPAMMHTLISKFDALLEDNRLLDKKLQVKANKGTLFHNIIVNAMMYQEIRQYIYPQFIRQLGIKSCVYCNAAFCVTDKKGVAYYTADHWKPKSRYPYLATSFFNLVPCCFSCNRNKGDDGGGYFCLYEDDKSAKLDVLHLRVPDKNIVEYIMHHNPEVLSIQLIEASAAYKSMRDNMDEKLHISNLYAEHKDVAEETLWRKIAYTKSNIEALNESLKASGLSLTSEEVYRFLYGIYPDSDDMHKRPLTRLIQDIMDDTSW